jgi:uncharacterized membrane protein
VNKNRLEAFSDGVFAILITILDLELKAPEGGDWAALRPRLPGFLVYILSFVFLGIYWSNHHHMLHAVTRINGKILWANLHLLFWLSLVPFGTGWLGTNSAQPLPTAFYGVLLLASAVAYTLLQQTFISDQGPDSPLAAAVGRDWKGRASMILYATGIGMAFVQHWVSLVLYVVVAGMWLVPDRRIERSDAIRT